MPPPERHPGVEGRSGSGESASDTPAARHNLHLLKQQIGAAQTAVGGLTDRQRQVLHGLLEGESNKQIARELGISPRTVEIHRRCLLDRLEARTTADAIRIAVYAGLPVDEG